MPLTHVPNCLLAAYLIGTLQSPNSCLYSTSSLYHVSQLTTILGLLILVKSNPRLLNLLYARFQEFPYCTSLVDCAWRCSFLFFEHGTRRCPKVVRNIFSSLKYWSHLAATDKASIFGSSRSFQVKSNWFSLLIFSSAKVPSLYLERNPLTHFPNWRFVYLYGTSSLQTPLCMKSIRRIACWRAHHNSISIYNQSRIILSQLTFQSSPEIACRFWMTVVDYFNPTWELFVAYVVVGHINFQTPFDTPTSHCSVVAMCLALDAIQTLYHWTFEVARQKAIPLLQNAVARIARNRAHGCFFGWHCNHQTLDSIQ